MVEPTQHFKTLDVTARDAFRSALLVYEMNQVGDTRTILVFPASESLSQYEFQLKNKHGKRRCGETLPWCQNAASAANQLNKWFGQKAFFEDNLGKEAISLPQADGKQLHAVVLEVPSKHEKAFELALQEHKMIAEDRILREGTGNDTLKFMQEKYEESLKQKAAAGR